jgi:protein-S-isoprenylcysteine O-methyltransferase Ste14
MENTVHHFIEYRPPRIAMSIIVLAAVVNLILPLSLHAPLPAAASITAIAGFALMLRAWWLFKAALTAICPTDTATTLITDDVYAISRNPMYLGMLMMLVAPAMWTGRAAFYVGALLFGVIIDRVFVGHEERKSLLEFGDDYAAYTKRIRRWL